MGGTNEFKIGDLRIHENSGEIHIHDDDKNVRFSMGKNEFQKQFDGLKDEFQTAFADGTVASIPGNKLKIAGKGGVLVAEIDMTDEKVNWSLEKILGGFDEMDSFLDKL